MIIRKINILTLLLILPFALLAQEDDQALVQSDTLSITKGTQVIGVPILFYTPETDFGLGAGVQFIFGNLPNMFNSRLSDMLVTGVYTTKKQFLLDVRPQIHIYDGQFYLEGLFRYKVFPNSFWGIGNQTSDDALESYNMQSTEIHAKLLKRIPPTLNFGFEYVFQHHKMVEYDSAGQLITTEIPGSEGATISSLSAVFTFDDRDNISSASKGNFLQFSAGFSSQVLGASYSYNKYKFDIRKYFLLQDKLTFAANYYLEVTYGRVPFQTMPWLGGNERMRGYFNGRYIDLQYHTIQSEIRWRLTPRFIIAGFASGGDVGESLTQLYRYFKYSYGGGVRYQISKKSPIFVRLDFGFGTPGNSGIYFGVNEAF
jgi:outer membrane protein assembly factor BamA